MKDITEQVSAISPYRGKVEYDAMEDALYVTIMVEPNNPTYSRTPERVRISGALLVKAIHDLNE